MKLIDLLESESSDDYSLWKKLVNMSVSELKKFLNSDLGKEAGLDRQEAKLAGGIKRGRDSARAIIRMKSKPFSEWDDYDKEWMKRQISFISRMSGNKGPLLDDDGNPTRKLTSLWIWGHLPKGLKPSKFTIENEPQ